VGYLDDAGQGGGAFPVRFGSASRKRKFLHYMELGFSAGPNWPTVGNSGA